MKICERCFCDKEVISIVKACNKKDTCDICKREDVCVYDTNENEELSEKFEDLIEIYTPISELAPEFPKDEAILLKTILKDRWNIFKGKSDTQIYRIIKSICNNEYNTNPKLFNEPVVIADAYNANYLKQNSLLNGYTWDDFVKSIRIHNRFHTKLLKLDLLEKFCTYIQKKYKKGDIFYRARIADNKYGYGIDDMGAAPPDKAPDGRANAVGISCLYLGNDQNTVISEVRASAYDYVCIGKFELLEDIVVVDLSRIDKICPFESNCDFKEYAINKEHLTKIDEEMGRVMRRSDKPLDYVPTQYIADFIKSIEEDGRKVYAGVEYNSVMNKGGYNLAIFNPELFECKTVEVRKVGLTYNSIPMEEDEEI